MTYRLKVKIMTLAAEARIIRGAEHQAKRKRDRCAVRQKSQLAEKYDIRRATLHTHRILIVRRHARAALLAYAFLRGVPYRRVENNMPVDLKGKLPSWQEKHPWPLVVDAIRTHGSGYWKRDKDQVVEEVAAWIQKSIDATAAEEAQQPTAA